MPLLDKLQLDPQGHIPTMVCDAATHQPLTLCYLTPEALEKTLETGLVHVFRRSLGKLMLKGETSGHTQRVVEVRPDCEGKSLVILVEQQVAACHKGYYSCYFERYNAETDTLEVVEERVFDPKKVY
ncbi:phosphoribosyl-AMP cyclohydrolase [bacterium]|nr:phosphoribosyl-AMP cyclohydrolase [bacterium]